MANFTDNTTQLQSLLAKANSLPEAITVDSTLSVAGAAADAKAVGDAIVDIDELVNTHTDQINEISINHIGSYSNPHNVTAAQVGAAPAYTYGTADMTAGTSALETGKLYFVYE